MPRGTPKIKPYFEILDTSSPWLRKKITRRFKVPLSENDKTLLKKAAHSLVHNSNPFYKKRALGISAPQFGIDKRFIVLANQEMPWRLKGMRIMANPEILEITDKTERVAEEGCLSQNEVVVVTSRPREVKVKYINLQQVEVTELLRDELAQVFLHEYDHLDGVLMVDNALEIKPNRPYLKFIKNL